MYNKGEGKVEGAISVFILLIGPKNVTPLATVYNLQTNALILFVRLFVEELYFGYS